MMDYRISYMGLLVSIVNYSMLKEIEIYLRVKNIEGKDGYFLTAIHITPETNKNHTNDDSGIWLKEVFSEFAFKINYFFNTFLDDLLWSNFWETNKAPRI